MLTFFQFISEVVTYRWVRHPAKGIIAVRQRPDEYGGNKPLHWQIADKHHIKTPFDSMERGSYEVRPHPEQKGRKHVGVSSYGANAWNENKPGKQPVPFDVIQHIQKKFPKSHIYDQNKYSYVNEESKCSNCGEKLGQKDDWEWSDIHPDQLPHENKTETMGGKVGEGGMMKRLTWPKSTPAAKRLPAAKKCHKDCLPKFTHHTPTKIIRPPKD